MRQLHDVSAEPGTEAGRGRLGPGAGVPALQQGLGRRRRKVAKEISIPKASEVAAGWGCLLDEISASARRVRTAKGGHIGMQGHERAATGAGYITQDVSAAEPEADATPWLGLAQGLSAGPRRCMITSPALGSHRRGGPINEAADVWMSYRIDGEKVPDKVLGIFWHNAVDPKHIQEQVAALERVPRLTVSRREVVLPRVYDIEHWRQVNKKRREQMKDKKEAERHPSLREMLRSIFGELPPASTRLLELKDPERFKRKTEMMVHWMLSEEELTNEQEIRAEIEQVLQAEAHEEELFQEQAPRATGVQKKGRRSGIDHGPQDPFSLRGGAGPPPFNELRDKADARHHKPGAVRNVKLRRGLEAARAAHEVASGSDESFEEFLGQVEKASVQVQDQCQHKLQRIHKRFLQKQGQLSARLQGRVRRLQLDFQEIHDMKVSSILPDAVTAGSSGSNGHRLDTVVAVDDLGKATPSVAGGTVLQYLSGHRHAVERTRQTQQSMYMQQVESFQHHVRLLADPNRVPERGEVYLSECFRHVLAAGLIVDTTYFIRVVQNLEKEDLQRTATVNMLAACCDAFDVDLRRYWAFLRDRSFPLLVPKGCPEQVRSWEDWAPWNGVTLEAACGGRHGSELADNAGEAATQEAEDMEVPTLQDPLPFGPIVPDEPPAASELVSREDPLAEMLEQVALDCVLARYGLSGTAAAPAAARPGAVGAHGWSAPAVAALAAVALAPMAEPAVTSTGGDPPEVRRPWPPAGASRPTPVPSPPPPPPLKPSTPPLGRRVQSARAPRRNHHSPAAHSTLQRTRAVAEPMRQMANAPLKARARPPPLAPVAERPAEPLE